MRQADLLLLAVILTPMLTATGQEVIEMPHIFGCLGLWDLAWQTCILGLPAAASEKVQLKSWGLAEWQGTATQDMVGPSAAEGAGGSP